MSMAAIQPQTATTGSSLLVLKDMDIHSRPGDIHIQSQPADLEIATRNPDIRADWQDVWDSIGLQNQLDFMQARYHMRFAENQEATAQKARDGDRIAASIHNGEKNVFGNLATERFRREREVQTELVLMPSTGPRFEVTVYKPQIEFTPHKPALSYEPYELRIILKPFQTSPSSFFMDRLV